MSKLNRYFEIIQIFRQATRPLLARDLAEILEVSTRTIYRDIAALQARQTPIQGAPGIGYVMRKGYDLPPLNFDIDEAEALAVGLSLIARTGDAGLWRAAKRAARKLNEAAPGTRHLIASSWGVDMTPILSMPDLRRAIRDERKLRLSYRDAEGATSERVIWPLVLIYYVDTALVVAWCELRADIRHFRLDRIEDWAPLDNHFTGRGAALIDQWEETQKEEAVVTQTL